VENGPLWMGSMESAVAFSIEQRKFSILKVLYRGPQSLASQQLAVVG
jgi:hypothetical protein